MSNLIEKTFLSDWSRNFLPLKQISSHNKFNIPAVNNIIYKEIDFTVNEINVNYGSIDYKTVQLYLKECMSILSLLAILLNKKSNIFNSLYITKDTFLNKSEEEIKDYKLLLEQGFSEKFILNRIFEFFENSENFKKMFSKLFKFHSNENTYIVYMYFIGCLIEIYELEKFMNINKLESINLSSKTFSMIKVKPNGTYYLIDIFLKGDSNKYKGYSHSHVLNAFEKKEVLNSFNAFISNEHAQKKGFLLNDLSIYLNSVYFEIVDKSLINEHEKQILKFLFNYIQYKILLESQETLKNSNS